MPSPSLLPRLRTRFAGVRRRWWLLGLVVVLAGVGGWIWLRPEAAAETQSVTQTVSRGTYKSTVSATGTITPVKEADLAFSSTGTVTAVAVSVGDTVRKGDLLAKIDDTALIAQRDAAEAQVSAARTQLSEAAGSSSAQLSADRASLAAAESQLAQAEEAVAQATLTAPFSGTVSAVGVEVGDQSGSQNQQAANGSGAQAAVSLITPKRLLVEANVSAADVSSLKRGLQAEITPTGGGGTAYGTVSDVGVLATASDSGAAQFPVTVEVTGQPSGLYPGSTATVAITVKQASDVLTVPTQALHTDGDGTTYVYVVDGGSKKKQTVRLGESYGMQTEVLTGLVEGAVVEVLSFTRPTGSGNDNGGGGGFLLPPGGGEIRMPAGGGSGPVFRSGP